MNDTNDLSIIRSLVLKQFRKTYSHLNHDERRKIEQWRAAKVSVDVIAEKLGRHRATIFRELKRNFFRDDELPDLNGYYCMTAAQIAAARRSDQRKLMRYPVLRSAVIERIQAGWSPQQIAGRLKFETTMADGRSTHLKRGILPLCHETIYRFVHSPFGQSLHLWRALPERRRQRRPRHARKRYGRRFGPEVSILHRPESVAKRKQFGHWEADLIQFRKKFGNANLTSLVERVSRFTVLSRNNDRQSRPIMEGLIRVLQSLPVLARRSITFDRGTEFTDWPYLQAGIGTQTWFCDPQSPWQKGTVENTNRRIWAWLSRDVDPLTISERDLKDVCARLNATPRKCLGYRTPAEVFRQKLMAQQRENR